MTVEYQKKEGKVVDSFFIVAFQFLEGCFVIVQAFQFLGFSFMSSV
jgi:hypothetical protein